MTDTSRTVTLDRARAELGAAAALLRRAAPLPPMGVHYAPGQDVRVSLTAEPSVAPNRQQVALRRLARHLGATPRGSGDRTWVQGDLDEVTVFAAAQTPTGGDHTGHGDTAAHADLVEELADWVHAMAVAGADQVDIRQALVPDIHPDHRFRALVHASGKVADRLVVLGASAVGQSSTSALAGTALAPTGHDVVIVRT